MWLSLPLSPNFDIASAVDPPPASVNALALAAIVSATAFVPPLKRGHSNTPIGPFQTILDAFFSRCVYSKIAAPSISNMNFPGPRAQMASSSTNSASGLNSSAILTSVGITIFERNVSSCHSDNAKAASSLGGFFGYILPSTNALTIPPPVKIQSKRLARLRIKASLSATFAPPITATDTPSLARNAWASASFSDASSKPA